MPSIVGSPCSRCSRTAVSSRLVCTATTNRGALARRGRSICFPPPSSTLFPHHHSLPYHPPSPPRVTGNPPSRPREPAQLPAQSLRPSHGGTSGRPCARHRTSLPTGQSCLDCHSPAVDLQTNTDKTLLRTPQLVFLAAALPAATTTATATATATATRRSFLVPCPFRPASQRSRN